MRSFSFLIFVLVFFLFLLMMLAAVLVSALVWGRLSVLWPAWWGVSLKTVIRADVSVSANGGWSFCFFLVRRGMPIRWHIPVMAERWRDSFSAVRRQIFFFGVTRVFTSVWRWILPLFPWWWISFSVMRWWIIFLFTVGMLFLPGPWPRPVFAMLTSLVFFSLSTLPFSLSF